LNNVCFVSLHRVFFVFNSCLHFQQILHSPSSHGSQGTHSAIPLFTAILAALISASVAARNRISHSSSNVLGFIQLPNQNSERSLSGHRHDSISKQPQFVCPIITGLVQLGMTHPIGSPISFSTQRGLSFPDDCVFI
jgi:hypothetical protein